MTVVVLAIAHRDDRRRLRRRSARLAGTTARSARATARSHSARLGLVVGAGVDAGPWVTVVLGVMVVLLSATVLNRARKGLAELH